MPTSRTSYQNFNTEMFDSLKAKAYSDGLGALGQVLGGVQNRFVQFQPVLVPGGPVVRNRCSVTGHPRGADTCSYNRHFND